MSVAQPSNPTVSVVTATYNYGKYLAQAIQSVIDQSYKDWELVIVDDGSSDNTIEVVQPFLSDNRVRYLKQENQGQPKAKNRAICKSRGEFIAFLDADDAWAPEKLSKQLPLFRDSQVGVTYTGVIRMDSEGLHIGGATCRHVRGHAFQESIINTVPPFSSAIIRRAVVDDVGLFNEAIP